MIEFKAECGHTIRAKDDDEGKVVRCSYCGRTTQVPDKNEDEFESLFGDVADMDAGGTVSAGQPIRPKRHRRVRGKSTGGRGSFNPFAVILKMLYAAAIIIVIILAGKLAYDYWKSAKPDRGGRQGPVAEKPDRDRPAQPGGSGSTSSGKVGLLHVRLDTRNGGIYVNSVPDQAMVRVRPTDEDAVEEIFLDPKAVKARTDSAVKLDPGMYEIAVALPLNDGTLMKYNGYAALRRLIEEGGSSRLLEGFFIPDDAREITTVDQPALQSLIVRKYEVRVTGTEWTPLTALFLPDEPLGDVIKYLPRRDAYGFVEEDIKRELDYYTVAEADQTYVIHALRRVGMAMYRLPDGSGYRCFMIHPISGAISSKVCSGY